MDNGVETVGVIMIEIIKTVITLALCSLLFGMSDKFLAITGGFF